MIRPNYRDFRRGSQFIVETGTHLEHSAKGSTWEDHKYIKRIDGTYYYPDNYEGGRHLPEGDKDKKETSMEDDLFEKLKDFAGDELDSQLRGSFDKILRDKLGVDWTTLPKEEVDKMQRSLIDRLKGFEKGSSTGGKIELTKNDVENLAKEVIRGQYGDGQTRKDLLGENYAEIQKRVNELMKGSTGQKKVSEANPESVKKAQEAAKKVDNSNVHSGVDLNMVLSVYRK